MCAQLRRETRPEGGREVWELTPDGEALVLAVVGYGVFRAELPELSES